MKRISIAFVCILGMASIPLAGKTFSPTAIVRAADRARAPARSFSVIIRITHYRNGKQTASQKVKVYVKDYRRSIVRFLAPARMKDRVMLMSGDNVWIHIPGTRNPIRLSPRQRLLGQAANGDIARMNFEEDYRATYEKRVREKGRSYHLLTLTARRKQVAYQKIRYLVSARTLRPQRAEYFALSGRSLKRAEFARFRPMGGAIRLSKLVIHDSIRKNEKTVLEYSAMRWETLPSAYFQKSYLKRIW